MVYVFSCSAMCIVVYGLVGQCTKTILIIYVYWKFPGQISRLLQAFFSTMGGPIEKLQNN